MMKRMPSTLLARGVAAAFAAWLIADASVARADTAGDKAMAQTLFEQARELVREKKFGEACPKLAHSLRLDRGTGTMLWLADCYENNGQTASAWVQFKEAAAAATLEHDARANVARRRAANLEPRLTKLMIVVPHEAQVKELTLKRDGVAVDPVEIGIASPVDPGAHTLTASAIGHKPWTATIDLPARPTTVTVSVPELAEEAPEPPAPEPVVNTVASAPPVSMPDARERVVEAPSSGSAMRIFGISLAGVGVLSIGAGAYLGLTAKSTYADSNRNGRCLPTNECDASGKDLRSRASGLATGSTIAFGAGAAVLLTGAILYFAAPRSSKAAVSVVPVVGSRVAGLELSRQW
jgi:serine/threonine-protein kinase